MADRTGKGFILTAAAWVGAAALAAGLCHRWGARRVSASLGAHPGGRALVPAEAAPESLGADAGPLRRAADAVAAAVDRGVAPGAVLLVGYRDRVILHEAFGTTAPPGRPGSGVPVTHETLFDLASLTKVVATAPAIHLLAERGAVDLTAPVSRYLPGFAARGKERITLAQLLTHASGLPPTLSTRIDPGRDRTRAVMAAICRLKPRTRPGTQTRYSDLGFILLGEIIRAATGRCLDAFAREEIFEPLGMRDTRFLPLAADPAIAVRCAATVRAGRILRGQVQDPTAAAMGGVAGHAGLFGTAGDLARYARMILNGGALDGARLFRPQTVARMCRVSNASPDHTRTLGWDHSSRFASPTGEGFGRRSFGHTGWTGTSIWIDPEREAFVILLANSASARRARAMKELRGRVSTLVARALPVPR